MPQKLLIFSIMLLFFSCYGNTQNIQESRERKRIEPVTFSIDSSKQIDKNKNHNFYYHDIFGRGHPVFVSAKNNKLPIDRPTILFEASKQQLPFFIKPGEKITLKYPGTDSIYFFIDHDLERNRELNLFRRLVLETGNIYYGFTLMPYHRKVQKVEIIKKMEEDIFHVKSRRLHILDSLNAIHPFTEEFFKMASISIVSTAFNDSLELYFQNRDLLMKLDLYKNYINEKVKSVKSIQFSPYQFYFKAVTRITLIAVSGNPHYEIKNGHEFIECFEFARKNFIGPAKDFLMQRFIQAALYKMLPVPTQYLETFQKECTSGLYLETVEKKLAENNNDISVGGIDFLKPLGGERPIQINDYLLENRGKVILLDLWASWCGPCRAEMPFSKRLQEVLNTELVKFVYISIDENEKDWLAAIETEKLKSSANFLLINPQTSAFLEKFKIVGIPRYILIDKQGKIISRDAPRPSDPELQTLIRKYL